MAPKLRERAWMKRARLQVALAAKEGKALFIPKLATYEMRRAAIRKHDEEAGR